MGGVATTCNAGQAGAYTSRMRNGAAAIRTARLVLNGRVPHLGRNLFLS